MNQLAAGVDAAHRKPQSRVGRGEPEFPSTHDLQKLSPLCDDRDRSATFALYDQGLLRVYVCSRPDDKADFRVSR